MERCRRDGTTFMAGLLRDTSCCYDRLTPFPGWEKLQRHWRSRQSEEQAGSEVPHGRLGDSSHEGPLRNKACRFVRGAVNSFRWFSVALPSRGSPCGPCLALLPVHTIVLRRASRPRVNLRDPGYAAGSSRGNGHAAWRLASGGGYRHRPSGQPRLCAGSGGSRLSLPGRTGPRAGRQPGGRSCRAARRNDRQPIPRSVRAVRVPRRVHATYRLRRWGADPGAATGGAGGQAGGEPRRAVRRAVPAGHRRWLERGGVRWAEREFPQPRASARKSRCG